MTRQSKFDELAAQLGFEYLAQPDIALMVGIEKVHPAAGGVDFSEVLSRSEGGLREVIGELRWSEARGSSSHSKRTIRQTTVYLQRPGLELPQLTIEPASAVTKVLARVLPLAGARRLDTDVDPEFGERFLVSTFAPGAARPLFTPELIAFLKRHPHLSVMTGGARLLVARKEELLDPREMPQLLREATELAELLSAADHRTRAQRPNSEDPEPQSRIARLAAIDVAGPTPEELEEFLDRPAPRDIPAGIGGAQLGGGSGFWMFFGAFMSFVGALFFAISKALGMTAGLVVGSILPVLGLSVLFVAWRLRRRAKHLLRHGEVIEARVGDIDRTGMTLNGVRRYKVSFRLEREGREETRLTNQYGRAAERALSLQESGAPTRLLLDPDDPRRSIWLQGRLP